MSLDNETSIDGYDVSLMFSDESASCHVHHKPSRTSATLEYLFDSGMLYDECMNDKHPVPQATIDEIEAWADENGYYGDAE